MSKIQKPEIHPDAFVANDASIHGNVEIQKDCSVFFHATIRSESNRIIICEGTNIQDNCVVHTDPNYSVSVGPRATVGHSVILHGCTVGEETMIGMGATILNGAKIGKHCLVGAGSLVTQGKEFPDGVMILGSPAKVVRKLTDEEIEMVSNAANHYIESANLYKNEQ